MLFTGPYSEVWILLPYEPGYIKSARCSAGPGIFVFVLYYTLTSNNVFMTTTFNSFTALCSIC